MTQRVNPSPGRPAESFPTAGAIAYGGHGEEGFIRQGSEPTRIAQQDLNISEGNLNTFAETHSSTSLDVTIDAGEAFIFGSWVCIDTSTTVTLASDTAGQTVYVGWDKDAADAVVIGLDSAFTNNGVDTDQRIELYTFDTDSSGVTAVSDLRRINHHQEATTFTGSLTVDGDIVAEGGETVWDESAGQIPQTHIEQGAGSGLDADTVDGVEATDLGSDVSNNGTTVTQSATDINFTTGLTAFDDSDGTSSVTLTDTDVTVAGKTVSLGGSTAIDHSDISNIGADDHHTRYSDEEAQDAIGTILGSNFTYDDATPEITLDDNFVQTSGDTMSGNLQMGSNRITNVNDPTNPKDAANKRYVDSIKQGLDIKESVVATTDATNIDLTSSSDPGAIDGITLSDGDRILLKDQTTASENGVYVATTAADPSSWVRASDADENDEVDAGMFIFVEEGSSFSDKGFVLVSDDPLVVGTDDLQFTQFSGAGQITAGSGLTKSGDTLAVDDSAIVSTINSETTLSVDISGDAASIGGESYSSIFGLTRRIQV